MLVIQFKHAQSDTGKLTQASLLDYSLSKYSVCKGEYPANVYMFISALPSKSNQKDEDVVLTSIFSIACNTIQL